MTVWGQCGWAMARAAGIGVLGLCLGYPVRALLADSRKGLRGVAWLMLLLPYLTPAVLVGYAYSSFSLSLVRYPVWNAVVYHVLLGMKLVPVAVLVLYFAPTFFSPEALHCGRLLAGRGSRLSSVIRRLSFLVRGPARAAVVAFALVFLFAFAEFELTSFFGIRSWTVSLSDAQVGGQLLSESLRLALPAMLCEALVLFLAMVILFGCRRPPRGPARGRTPLGRAARGLGWGYLALAVGAVTGVPLFMILAGAIQGLGALKEHLVLWMDIGASMLFAVGAACCAYLFAGWFLRGSVFDRSGRGPLIGAYLISVPGLLGALLLSLLVLSLFQAPALREARETPVPLLLALVLLLLPFALLLRLLLHAFRPGEALAAAGMLRSSSSSAVRGRGRQLVWEMKLRGRFWVAFLLFCWAYFDLTASTLLAPLKMTPVFKRLYNLMHYGQTTVRSAMVTVAFCVPLLVLLGVGAARDVWVRLTAHE